MWKSKLQASLQNLQSQAADSATRWARVAGAAISEPRLGGGSLPILSPHAPPAGSGSSLCSRRRARRQARQQQRAEGAGQRPPRPGRQATPASSSMCGCPSRAPRSCGGMTGRCVRWTGQDTAAWPHNLRVCTRNAAVVGASRCCHWGCCLSVRCPSGCCRTSTCSSSCTCGRSRSFSKPMRRCDRCVQAHWGGALSRDFRGFSMLARAAGLDSAAPKELSA